jgi:hypothetical protein
MSEEYCVGVKILLERMDTNPEEFIAPFNQIKGARWSNLMSGIIAHKLEKDVRGDVNFLTEAEVDAVFKKYKALRRKAFDDHILREVLGADEQLSSYSKPKSILTSQTITEQSLQILQRELLKQNVVYTGNGAQTASIK